ncbi:hypothetical protein LXL04_022532 [Taraxacum kok-saghyz]
MQPILGQRPHIGLKTPYWGKSLILGYTPYRGKSPIFGYTPYRGKSPILGYTSYCGTSQIGTKPHIRVHPILGKIYHIGAKPPILVQEPHIGARTSYWGTSHIGANPLHFGEKTPYWGKSHHIGLDISLFINGIQPILEHNAILGYNPDWDKAPYLGTPHNRANPPYWGTPHRDGQDLEVPGSGSGTGGNRRFRNWNWSNRIRFQILKSGIWSNQLRFQILKSGIWYPPGTGYLILVTPLMRQLVKVPNRFKICYTLDHDSRLQRQKRPVPVPTSSEQVQFQFQKFRIWSDQFQFQIPKPGIRQFQFQIQKKRPSTWFAHPNTSYWGKSPVLGKSPPYWGKPHNGVHPKLGQRPDIWLHLVLGYILNRGTHPRLGH